MMTIFCYETKMHFLEEMEELKVENHAFATRDAACWFNPEDLDACWQEALEEMELVYSYMVVVDWDFNIVREFTRKD